MTPEYTVTLNTEGKLVIYFPRAGDKIRTYLHLPFGDEIGALKRLLVSGTYEPELANHILNHKKWEMPHCSHCQARLADQAKLSRLHSLKQKEKYQAKAHVDGGKVIIRRVAPKGASKSKLNNELTLSDLQIDIGDLK